MGICNFCSLKEWRRDASHRGNKVKTFTEDGWQRVYEYPKAVDIDSLTPQEREPYKRGTLYLEVPLGCAC